jgi:predicted ferric reductase
MKRSEIKSLIHLLLTVSIALYIITGLGITRSRIIENWTLGLLTKDLSYQIHVNLLIPFILLLLLHIYLVGKGP